MTTPDHQIAALKRERAGYVSRGLDDRVAQVDKELARLQKDESAEDNGPQGRTQAPQQTADQGKDPVKRTAKKTAAKKTTTAPPAEPASAEAPAAPPAE
jgi:hypothetical protein